MYWIFLEFVHLSNNCYVFTSQWNFNYKLHCYDHKITQSLLVIYLFIILMKVKKIKERIKKVRESLSMNWLSCSSSQQVQVRPFWHAKPLCQAKQKTKEDRHSRVKTTQNSCWFDLKQRILRSCENKHTKKESRESISLLNRQLTIIW